MNNFLARLEKYKYGMFVMVVFFVAFSMIRIQTGFVERPNLAEILNTKQDDLIELKIEPIEMVEERIAASGAVQNLVNDENSNGKGSSGGNMATPESYTSARSLKDVENSVYELERSFFEETGGAQARAAIQKEMDQRKKEQEAKQQKNETNTTQKGGGQNSVGTSVKGNVLVSYSLKNRSGQYVPAPGYMCPQGTTGKIIVNIKVDNSGKVIDAKVNSSSSNNECMVSYALEFAYKSRFSYKADVGVQEGTITYTYVN